MTNEHLFKLNLIDDISEQLSILSQMSEKRLEKILRKMLHGYWEDFYTDRKKPYAFIVEIFSSPEANIEFRPRLCKVIGNLLYKFVTEFDSKSYLGDLLYLVGRLRVVEPNAYLRRLQWLETRYFVNQYIDEENKLIGEDLHLMILRSIFDQVQSQDREKFSEICKRSIGQTGILENPYHFPICYRLLWQIYPNNATDYFKDLLTLAQQGYFSLQNELQFLCEAHEDLIKKYVFDNLDYFLKNPTKALFLSNSLDNLSKSNIFPLEFLIEHYPNVKRAFFQNTQEIEIQIIFLTNIMQQAHCHYEPEDISRLAFAICSSPLAASEPDPEKKTIKAMYWYATNNPLTNEEELVPYREQLCSLVCSYLYSYLKQLESIAFKEIIRSRQRIQQQEQVSSQFFSL